MLSGLGRSSCKCARQLVRTPLRKKNTAMTECLKPGAQPDYEACIHMLNNLQTNAQYIKTLANNSRPTNSIGGVQNSRNLEEVRKFLRRTGLSVDRLDGNLSVIHVAGTKGKGTTCAFAESILRRHGHKTGFYSSPHLLEVRERIRINGRPIPKDMFAKYFWQIYVALDEQKSDPYDMPLYFRFLTVMALKVFLEEKVDVAILEVGIGGEMDCTNVLRKVPVVGITSLGIEHTVLLGNTLESIAWNKAGIMKESCKAFTVPQPETAMKVLRERSVEKKCTLQVVDSLDFEFSRNNNSPTSTAPSCPVYILNLNAGLAVALCEAWLSTKGQIINRDTTKMALSKCVWPGRFQVKTVDNVTYHIDGAHTLESITICADWFRQNTACAQQEGVGENSNTLKNNKIINKTNASAVNANAMNEKNINEDRNRGKKKALMFNVTGGRDSKHLLRILMDHNRFDLVMFVTNTAGSITDSADNLNLKLSTDDQLVKCQEHKRILTELVEEDENLCRPEAIEVFPTVLDGIKFLNAKKRGQPEEGISGSTYREGSDSGTTLSGDGRQPKYDLLVTGSLHLVGAVLSIIDPKLNEDVEY